MEFVIKHEITCDLNLNERIFLSSVYFKMYSDYD